MTDPLEGVTDAHLQAALDAAGYVETLPSHVRRQPRAYCNIIALARQIAAKEKLAAELAELRAKYEPEPVAPVGALAMEIVQAFYPEVTSTYNGRRKAIAIECIRRGMGMQPAPSRANDVALFTREEIEAMQAFKNAASLFSQLRTAIAAWCRPETERELWLGVNKAFDVLAKADAGLASKSSAELRAMLGEG